jgi:PAS domain S-box-containing protein
MIVQHILDRKQTRIISLPQAASIAEVAEILSAEDIGTVMLTNQDGGLAGIISERDLIKAFAGRGETIHGLKAADFMTTQVVTCTPETSLSDVLAMMSLHEIRHLPVVRERQPVGLISVRDVLDTQRQMLLDDLERRKQHTQCLQDDRDALEKAFAARTAALEASESRYRKLIEGSELGISIERPGAEVIFANDACARMFGFDDTRQYRAALSEPASFIAPHDRDRILANMVARMEGNPALNDYEYDALKKDGSIVPVRVFVQVIMWDGKEPLHRTFIDISKRHKAEKKFRKAEQARVESDERLRAIIDHSPSLIYLKDTESRILLINKAYEQHYGVTQEDALGSQGYEWQERKNVEKLKTQDQKVISGGQPVVTEIGRTDAAGESTFLQSIKFPVRDTAGKIVGIGGFVADITDRKRAEETLAQKSALLQTTLEHMAEGIAVYDSDLKLIAYNQIFAEVYEFPPGFIQLGLPYEKISRHVAECGHYGVGDVEEQVRIRLERARGGVPVQLERTGTNGKTIAVWRNPLPGGGFVNTYTDVTERKRADEALRQAKSDAEIAAAEAREANTAKSRFLAAMSHELRTPLNAVIGFSDIMRVEALGPVGSPRYREYANDINQAGTHLLSLINDILDISKIEANKDELYEETLDIHGAINAAAMLVRQRADKNSVALILEIEESLPDLCADERKLTQILVNLLTNAIKFSKPGGTVTVNAWCRPDSGFVFQVADTGIGIAPQDIPKALSLFGQVDNDLNRQYEGTGLACP